MILVEEARARILAALTPVPVETVALGEALGRVLAETVTARVSQPPSAVSAMDGYAVRAADVAETPVTLRRIGEAPAGRAFTGVVGPGEAVRIFTGGPVPEGADAIVIQENTEAQGEDVVVRKPAPAGRFIRPEGLDFRRGDPGPEAGRRLTVRDVALAAAMNAPWLTVRRRPRIAILATGDEVVMPGEPLAPHQIVGSNTLALAAFASAFGATAINLGVARDSVESLSGLSEAVRGADLLVTTGGVSVGEHDLVRSALEAQGMALDFWKIAMRPGKPLLFGRIAETPVLGFPGNPVSTLVCAAVFLRPAIEALLGRREAGERLESAALGRDLAANDERQDYLRARLAPGPNGQRLATPFERQDSAMLATLAQADCLVVRPPHAPAAAAGEKVDILPLAGSAIAL